jgi:glutaminyl-peptide cyclotransferase
MKNRILVLVGFLFLFLQVSCGEKKQSNIENTDSSKSGDIVTTVSPIFNGDSAYHFVATQVAFGPRVPNTISHENCRNYLVNYFRSLGLTVLEQKFRMAAYNGASLSLSNIIISINPEARKRVLLAAHWDTRPFADQDSRDTLKAIDGANDGASGVAVLMEIARVMSTYGKMPNVGVDIILFDGEDYGRPQFDHSEGVDGWCLGSEYWSKNKHAIGYTANYGILLDMVGATGARFAREERSLYYASGIVDMEIILFIRKVQGLLTTT